MKYILIIIIGTISSYNHNIETIEFNNMQSCLTAKTNIEATLNNNRNYYKIFCVEKGYGVD